jgi:hypothetical protein
MDEEMRFDEEVAFALHQQLELTEQLAEVIKVLHPTEYLCRGLEDLVREARSRVENVLSLVVH